MGVLLGSTTMGFLFPFIHRQCLPTLGWRVALVCSSPAAAASTLHMMVVEKRGRRDEGWRWESRSCTLYPMAMGFGDEVQPNDHALIPERRMQATLQISMIGSLFLFLF